MRALALVAVACSSAPTPPGVQRASPYPKTARRPVTDTYLGTAVVDDYRWLEDAPDPEVVAWTAAQNQLTRTRLDAIAQRPAIHARVAELMANKPASYFDLVVRGDLVFAKEDQPPKQQPILVVTATVDTPGSERVVLD